MLPYLQYGTGTLTMVFLSRVFQECLTYEGEMDYKTYLDFVLAIENKREPAALQYLFKLLDIQVGHNLNFPKIILSSESSATNSLLFPYQSKCLFNNVSSILVF